MPPASARALLRDEIICERTRIFVSDGLVLG
jgi:hypothetical protein